MPKGTAISKAMSEETRVPYINGKAPNCSATGSHVDVTRKWNPNFLMASVEPCHSCQPVKTISTITVRAMASVSHSNALSPKRDGRFIAAAAVSGSPRTIAGATAIFVALHFDLVDTLQNARLHVV